MSKTCNSCLPKHQGYTFFFAHHQSPAILDPYYATCDDTKWIMQNPQTVWVEEHTAFNLLDCLDIYFDIRFITFIRTPKHAPFSSAQEREPLQKLWQEKKLNGSMRLLSNDVWCRIISRLFVTMGKRLRL